VVKAMADKALYGKKYGEKNSHRKNFREEASGWLAILVI
jgi:hypothetical protein